MQVKIMRGISGAGKSTYAKKLRNEAHARGETPMIVSADEFFVGYDGCYKFDPTKLGEAHKWCMQHFLRLLQDKVGPIIVDNTNIYVEDIAPYVAVGEAMGYDVEIVQVNVDPMLAAKRNVHGVPQQKVYEMCRMLGATKLPRRWNVTQVGLIRAA